MTARDIWTPTELDCAGGRVRVQTDGEIVAAGPPGESRLTDEGLSNSGWAAVWCSASWGLVVGEKDPGVIGVWPLVPRVARVAELERLDLEGGIDPGGLHRVRFIEIPDGDVLIVFEFGAARIHPDGSQAWQVVHRNLIAQVTEVSPDFMWWDTDPGRFGVRLSDGKKVLG